MIWWAQWGENLKFLEAMARRGNVVPALENKPGLPEHLLPAFTCYTDIVREGLVQWSDYANWAERYGVKDEEFEYLWDVIGKAIVTVQKWRTSRKSPDQKRPSTGAPKSSVLGSTPTF